MTFDDPLHVILVHGLFSEPETWSSMVKLLHEDEQLSDRCHIHQFAYSSPKYSVNPSKRVPDINDIARSLDTFVRTAIPNGEPIVLVGHSQGGLVIQKFVSNRLASGLGADLHQIRAIVFYATPNSGSEFMLASRKIFGRITRNSQERELRPFVSSVYETHRLFINGVVRATTFAPSQAPIPVHAYGGAEDAIVSSASAMASFPNSGVLPGDHTGIIRPVNSRDPRYRVLHSVLTHALDNTLSHGDNPSEVTKALEEIPNTPVKPVAPTSESRKGAIARALLEIREFRDEADRRQIVQFMPPYIASEVSAGHKRTYCRHVACQRLRSVRRSVASGPSRGARDRVPT